MAIIDGSRVTMTLESDAFGDGGDWTPQPPITGIAYGVGEGGTTSVLWENGLQTESVPLITLDELTTAGDESLALFGKTVTVTDDKASANYEAVVVAIYSRAGDTKALVKSIAASVYREVGTPDLKPVPGH